MNHNEVRIVKKSKKPNWFAKNPFLMFYGEKGAFY